MKLYKGDIKRVLKSNLEFKKTSLEGGFDYLIYDYLCSEYKKDATLIALPNNRFIDIEVVKSKLDLLKVYYYANQLDANFQVLFSDKRIMESEPSGLDALFVDDESLVELSKKDSRKIMCKL